MTTHTRTIMHIVCNYEILICHLNKFEYNTVITTNDLVLYLMCMLWPGCVNQNIYSICFYWLDSINLSSFLIPLGNHATSYTISTRHSEASTVFV